MDAEDRIFVLEDALESAYNLAEFLYHCLVTDGYTHAYPGMSKSKLDELEPLVRERIICFHSSTSPGCKGCEQRNAIFKRRAEIKRKYA